MMAGIQDWVIANEVHNFCSVPISGYHIAEAGANPISQLAFTLANGFTYVESYLARGPSIDKFAPNLSFFLSSGMDAEYTVLGRVARRIWAVATRERYGANERSQKFEYHVQTSGRSLPAQEVAFNDIRTTLQALNALYDNCNNLHTNAYQEAVTTPSAASVRRALAIQLIINTRNAGYRRTRTRFKDRSSSTSSPNWSRRRCSWNSTASPSAGEYSAQMETGYQRGKIQDESMRYEQRKHDGSLPLIGVNTFPADHDEQAREIELARGTETEKQSQLSRLADFHERNRGSAAAALADLRTAAREGRNVFAVLLEEARVCSLGQITDTFFEVGGAYRSNV